MSDATASSALGEKAMRKRTVVLSLGLACIVAAACSGSSETASTSNDLSTSSDSNAEASKAKVVQVVERSDIVSNKAGGKGQDEELENAWGLAFSSFGTAWVSAAETGVSGVYDAEGKHVIPNVTIPTGPNGKPPAHPTGQVFNPDAKYFFGDAFIFVTEDGTVSGWQPGAGQTPSTLAVLRADNSPANASYKGLAIAPATGGPRLYAADFFGGRIDVFDPSYNQIESAGKFVDDQLPAGYAPFNVQAYRGLLFVAYAKQDEEKADEVKGAGNGYVDVYDADGNLVSRLIQGGALNAPWGIAVAPEGFGDIGGRLLVGNFGDGKINVYDLTLGIGSASATFEGVLGDEDGKPIVVDGLWALQFGNDQGGFSSKDLYFTAGPNDEEDGVFGELEVEGEEEEGGGNADGGSGDGGASSDGGGSDGGGAKTF